MNTQQILLDISKRDLKAAKCLFENGLYPQAIFYLQQAVEKAVKSFAIMTNAIKEKEVKAIDHYPLRITEQLLNKQKEKLERLNNAFGAIPKLKETLLLRDVNFDEMHGALDRSQEAISSIQSKPPVFLSKQEIMQLVEDLNKFETEVTSAFASIPPPDQEFIDMWKRGILEFVDVLYEYNPPEAEKLRKEFNALSPNFLKKIIDKTKPLLIDLYCVYFSLFYLSIITFPHAVSARYPNGESNPLEIYKNDFPLVELFGLCVEKAEKTLTKIENLKNFGEEAGQILREELEEGEK